MNINNSVTSLGGSSGLSSSSSLDGSNTGSSSIGDFQSIIQHQLANLNSNTLLKKTYSDQTGAPPLSLQDNLASLIGIQHPSELDTFCDTLNTLFKDKDVISFLNLSGTQLDQFDAFYATYTQDNKTTASIAEASRSQLHQLIQAQGPTQAIFDEIKSNLDKTSQQVENEKLNMLYALNKILTPDQMGKAITLVEQTLNPPKLTTTPTA